MRIRDLARAGRVRFTLKAIEEIALLDLDLDPDDACDVLAALTPGEFFDRLQSPATGEPLLVFNPVLASVRLYVKLILRADCVVISFHADEQPDDDDPKAA